MVCLGRRNRKTKNDDLVKLFKQRSLQNKLMRVQCVSAHAGLLFIFNGHHRLPHRSALHVHLSTPFYATPGRACVCNLSRRRIRTRAPFHRLPVRERFQPATDKGKITKPRKLPENDAHPVASSGVALPEKEDGGRRRQAPRIHGNSGWFRSHFQVNYFFLAIVYGPCGAHCRPDLTLCWGFGS